MSRKAISEDFLPAKMNACWPEMIPIGRDRDDEMLYPDKAGDKLSVF